MKFVANSHGAAHQIWLSANLMAWHFGWHEPTRSLLVIELKTELVDLQETVGTLDRKVRLATQIAHEQGWDAAKLDVFTGVINVAVKHIAAQTKTPIHYIVGELRRTDVEGQVPEGAE